MITLWNQMDNFSKHSVPSRNPCPGLEIIFSKIIKKICPLPSRAQVTTAGSEDCLNLAVFTPNFKPKKLMPVLVFIHGGAFILGLNSKYILLWILVTLVFDGVRLFGEKGRGLKYWINWKAIVFINKALIWLGERCLEDFSKKLKF